jgi:hypothetical protein
MNPPMALDQEILTLKDCLRAAASPPVHGSQNDQVGQDSCLQDRLRMAISNGPADALAG